MSRLTPPASSDFFDSEMLLTEEEKRIRATVAEFNDRVARHGAAERWTEGRFDKAHVRQLADLGVIGGGVEGYGCAGHGDVADGIVAMELAKVEFGLSAFFGIQSVLSLRAISSLGTEAQKQRWLPKFATGELVGALAVTEPDHGSDTAGMETHAVEVDDGYLISGTKKWIGNASFADLIIVMAKTDDGSVSAFVVSSDSEGYSAEPLESRVAMRSSLPTLVRLENVFVPAENRLSGADDSRATAAVFNAVRPIAAWQALGLSVGAYEAVLEYLSEREQFGRRLVEFQLVQEKLATMAVTISQMRLTCIQLSRALQNGTMTYVQASAAKLVCARQGREVVAMARDLMGGNGILSGYKVGRHFADMEAVFTYDGTDHIQSLIVGKAITGVSALR